MEVVRCSGFGRMMFPMVFFWVTSLACTGLAHSADGSGGHKGNEVSSKDLEAVVELLENPDKREVFLETLRQILASKDMAEEDAGTMNSEQADRGAGFRSIIEKAFGTLSRLEDFGSEAPELISELKDGFRKVPEFLRDPTKVRRLGSFMWAVGLSLAALLAAVALVRRFVPLRAPAHASWFVRPVYALIGSAFRTIPLVVCLVVFLSITTIRPSFPILQEVFALGFLLFIVYRLFSTLSAYLLSPDDPDARILPAGDKVSRILYRKLRSIGVYAVVYFFIMGTLTAERLPADLWGALRGGLLLGFPLLLTGLVLQVSRATRRHADEGDPDAIESAGTPLRPLVKLWPVPVLAYVWVVFLSLALPNGHEHGYVLRTAVGSMGVVAAAALAFSVHRRCYERMQAWLEGFHVEIPGLEEKALHYLAFLRKSISVLLMLATSAVLAEVWGAPVFAYAATETGSGIILRVITILAAIAGIVAFISLSTFVASWMLQPKNDKEPDRKRKTLVPLADSAAKIGAVFILGIIVLGQLGVDTGPILAGAGIIGLAVGFGAQSLVKDVINGLFIVIQDLISVGDVAVLGDKSGVVEAVGLRTMQLRDLAGNVHVIPNSSISTVTNMTRNYSRYVLDIGVSYGEDVDEVMMVLREVDEELRSDPAFAEDILEPLEILGVDGFGDSSVNIKARITTRPIRQWAVGREFNRRMKIAFDRHGIEIPFPQRTLWMGQPKEGESPALNMVVRRKEDAADPRYGCKPTPD